MLKRVPVIVVSGFLGSGKTTFLRFLLKETKKKIGLIINEFGDVGIDGDLIKNCNNCEKDNYDNIIELNNGCLCCTVQDDFIPSLKTLLKPDSTIEVIIIETSGLALPIPLLKALNWPDIRNFVYLDLVIGIVNGESMLKNSPINNLTEIYNQFDNIKIIEHNSSIEELFEEQLEVSDIVLISRADLLNQRNFKEICQRIKNKFNIKVPIIGSYNGSVDLGFIFDSNIKKNNYKNFITEEHNHNHPELFSDFIKCNYFLTKEEFEVKIVEILKDISILRIKGRIWIPDKLLPLQIQIVGRKINIWYEEAPPDCWRPENNCGMELVIIGLDKQSINTFKSKITEKFNIYIDP